MPQLQPQTQSVLRVVRFEFEQSAHGFRGFSRHAEPFGRYETGQIRAHSEFAGGLG